VNTVYICYYEYYDDGFLGDTYLFEINLR